MTTPGEYNITIYQGATFALNVTWKDSTGSPVNLTGNTARMQIRASLKDSAVLASLTTENGAIVLGGSAGTVALTLAAAATALITARRGVYDLEIQDTTGRVTRLLAGSVEFSPEVTR